MEIKIQDLVLKFAGGPQLINPKDVPSKPSSGAPGAANKQNQSSGKNTPAGSVSGISEAQTNAVATMQGLMHDLSMKITTNADKISALFAASNPKINSEYLKESAKGFARTGKGSWGGSFDGVWGDKTKTSLVNIKNFIKLVNPKIMIQEGNGIAPYKEMKDDEVVKIASDNITNLVRIFEALHLETSQAVAKVSGSGSVLDNVGPNLSQDQLNDPLSKPPGTLAVTAGHLKDFRRFFGLINGLILEGVSCAPLSRTDRDTEKAAKLILESSIVKIAQSYGPGGLTVSPDRTSYNPYGYGPSNGEAPAVYSPAAPIEPKQRSTVSGRCLNEIDKIIDWFISRAGAIYSQLSSAADNAEPHPRKVEKGEGVSKADLDNATIYMSGMDNIARQWGAIRDSVEAVIRKHKMENEPVVTRSILDEAIRGYNSEVMGPGNARTRSERPGENSSAQTIPGDQSYGADPLKGPLDYFMRLNYLISSGNFSADQNIVAELRSLSPDNKLPNIDIKNWNGGTHWTTLAKKYIEKDTTAEQYRSFIDYSTLIVKLLNSLYRYWANDNEEKLSQEIVRQQDQILNKWYESIRATQASCRSTLGTALDNLSRNESQPMSRR